jgi:glycosyltransferase involved in cell wall biosynthesis
MTGSGQLPISVVVPFRDSGRYIARCAEGLISQSFSREDYEIIMVDSGSSDASAEIVKGYPPIHLLFEGKHGAYAARNRALQEARGEVIAFTDPDCVPSRDWLRELIPPFGEPEVGIVLGSHEYAHDSTALSMLETYDNQKKAYVCDGGVREILYGHGNNMAVRSSLFRELGPFAEKPRGSDTAFVRLCADRYSAKAIRYAPKACVRHLEIDSVGAFYRKLFIYGGSGQRHGHAVYASPLSTKQRFEVFRSTVRTQGYSGVRSAVLLALLAAGLAYWVGGRIAAKWSLGREEYGTEQRTG